MSEPVTYKENNVRTCKRNRLFTVFLIFIGTVGCGHHVIDPLLPHDTFVIDSSVMSEKRVINIYLPPGYSPSGSKRYEVMYMPDGGIKEDFPHIANTIDTAIRAGEMRELILVGIENTVRRRDMTSPTEVEEDRKVAPVIGGSEVFRSFIADELIPQIHSRYRVSDESGIIGESLAGLFIVEIFFLQPELFDTYIAISPSLWWNNEELVRKAGDRLASGTEFKKTLHFSSANEEDIVPATARLAEILRERAPEDLMWKYQPQPQLRHDTIYRAVSPKVLRELFPVLASKTNAGDDP